MIKFCGKCSKEIKVDKHDDSIYVYCKKCKKKSKIKEPDNV